MPLFMDFHKIPGITIEEVKNAHIADLSVQDKYGVTYKQFWVNEDAGTVFCLMQGPDKEHCEAVHREAHGDIACAIVEVEPGLYEQFMGRTEVDNGHMVLNKDGSPDTAHRHVLVTAIQGVTTATHSRQYRQLHSPLEARKLVLKLITQFGGRRVQWQADDNLIGAFDTALNARQCALSISQWLTEQKREKQDGWNIIFRIGLTEGQPLTEKNAFFERTVKLACWLSNIAPEDGISVAKKSVKCIEGETDLVSYPRLKLVEEADEKFIALLFEILEGNLANEQFKIEQLTKDLAMSRPQLYRRILALTGRSPINLMRDLRMNKALALLRNRHANISEVALEVGYQSPSYFAQCFHRTFGYNPSEFAAVNAG